VAFLEQVIANVPHGCAAAVRTIQGMLMGVAPTGASSSLGIDLVLRAPRRLLTAGRPRAAARLGAAVAAVGGGFPALLASCRRPDAPPPTPQAAIAGAQAARPAQNWHAARKCGRAPPGLLSISCMPGPSVPDGSWLEPQERGISPALQEQSAHARLS